MWGYPPVRVAILYSSGHGQGQEVHVPGSLLGHCLEKLYTLLGNDPEQRVCNQIKFGAETLEHRRTYTEVHCQQGFPLMKSVESSTVRFSEGPLANISNSSGLLKEDGKRVRHLTATGFHYTEEALPKLFQPFQTFFSHIVIKVTSYSL